jgi:AcrR family transcriptional regulator
VPRQADPDLERRILDAAQKLWKRGGEQALTMRAVAKAARTTTPTVYQRFASRQHILRALLHRIQADFIKLIETCDSAEALAESYIQFAVEHPLEYELFFSHQDDLFHELRRRRAPAQDEPRPGLKLARKKLAEWLGGKPDDYVQLQLALWALAHGAAMLLVSHTARDDAAIDLRKATRTAVSVLLKNLAPAHS